MGQAQEEVRAVKTKPGRLMQSGWLITENSASRKRPRRRPARPQASLIRGRVAWGWPQALLQLVLRGDEVGRESSAPGQYEGTRPALKGWWQGRLGILGLPARDGVPLRPWSPERGSEAGSRSLVLPPGGDDWDDRRPRARRIFISHWSV